MAAVIKFDGTRSARVRTRAILEPALSFEMEITRQVMVTGLNVSPGDSDPSVLLKCFDLPAYPKLFALHPDPKYAFCFVQGHDIKSISVSTDTVDTDVVYRGPVIPSGGGLGGGIFFTLDQQTQTSSVQQYMTADGEVPLFIGYYPGAEFLVSGVGADTVPFQKIKDAEGKEVLVKPDIRAVNVQKLRCSEILRASALATKAQWAAVKQKIKAARGKINGKPWGSDPRGYWLFLGRRIRNYVSDGSALFIELYFAGDEKLWFGRQIYRDIFGNVPSDVEPEAKLLENLPAANGMRLANGIGMYSVYSEDDFEPLFGFEPD